VRSAVSVWQPSSWSCASGYQTFASALRRRVAWRGAALPPVAGAEPETRAEARCRGEQSRAGCCGRAGLEAAAASAAPMDEGAYLESEAREAQGKEGARPPCAVQVMRRAVGATPHAPRGTR